MYNSARLKPMFRTIQLAMQSLDHSPSTVFGVPSTFLKIKIQQLFVNITEIFFPPDLLLYVVQQRSTFGSPAVIWNTESRGNNPWGSSYLLFDPQVCVAYQHTNAHM